MPKAMVQDGIELEYEVLGEGEPILLVMGLSGQLVDWPDEFVDLFVNTGHQVIRFDNRDTGLSTQTTGKTPSLWRSFWAAIRRKPAPWNGYTIEDMADDAAGLLDAIGIDSAHVVGASMGGMITQALAIRHPHRVRSICSIMSNTGDRKNGLISPSLARKFITGAKPETVEEALEATVEFFELASGPHYDAGTFRMRAKASLNRSFTPAGVTRQMAAIGASPDRTQQLGQLACPTLVVHGLVDPLVKPSGGIATAKAIPGSRLLMFPDMGHDLPEPRWLEMRDEILANIQRA